MGWWTWAKKEFQKEFPGSDRYTVCGHVLGTGACVGVRMLTGWELPNAVLGTMWSTTVPNLVDPGSIPGKVCAVGNVGLVTFKITSDLWEGNLGSLASTVASIVGVSSVYAGVEGLNKGVARYAADAAGVLIDYGFSNTRPEPTTCDTVHLADTWNGSAYSCLFKGVEVRYTPHDGAESDAALEGCKRAMDMTIQFLIDLKWLQPDTFEHLKKTGITLNGTDNPNLLNEYVPIKDIVDFVYHLINLAGVPESGLQRKRENWLVVPMAAFGEDYLVAARPTSVNDHIQHNYPPEIAEASNTYALADRALSEEEAIKQFKAFLVGTLTSVRKPTAWVGPLQTVREMWFGQPSAANATKTKGMKPPGVQETIVAPDIEGQKVCFTQTFFRGLAEHNLNDRLKDACSKRNMKVTVAILAQPNGDLQRALCALIEGSGNPLCRTNMDHIATFEHACSQFTPPIRFRHLQDVLAGEYRDTNQELLEAMLLKGLTLENMTQRLAWLNAQRWATSVVRNIPGSEERPEWLAIKILFSCYRRPENSLKLAFDSVSDYVSGASDIEAIQNAFFGGVLSPEDRLLKLFFHRLSPEEVQSKMTVLSEDPSKAAIIAGILENPQTLQAHVFTTLQKCADGSSMPFDSYRRLEQAAIWMRCSVSALYHAVSKRPCESDSALLLDVFFAGLTLDNVADRFSNMGQLGMWASHALRQILTDESGDDRIQAFQALYTYFQDPVALTRKQSVTLEVAFDCFIPPCGSSLHLSRALGRTIEMDQEQLVTKFFTGLTLDNLKVRLKNLQKLKEGKGSPALQEAFALIIEAPNNDEQKGIKGLWECYKDPSLVEQRSHVQFLNSAATQFEPAVELRDLQAYLKDPAAFTTEQATLPVTTFLSRIGTDVFDELVTTRQGPQPQAGAAEGTNQAWRRHVMNMPAHIRRVGYGKPIFLDDPASSSTLASGLYQRQIGAMDNILAFYQIRMTFHRTFENTETAGRKPHPLRNKVAHYSFFALEAARKDLLGGLAQLENQSREKRVNNIDCWRYDNYFKASPLPETVEAAESTVKLRLAILSYCYEELLHSNPSEEKHAQLMAGIEGALVDIAMLFQLPTLAFDHQPDAASGCSRAVTAISPKFLELWKEFNPRLTDIRNSHCHATTIASEGPGTEKRGSSVSEEAIIKCVEDLVGWSTSQKVLTLHDWQLCPSTHSASQAVQVLEERLIQLSGLAAQYSSTLVTGQTWTPTQNQAVTPCITDIQSSIAIIKQYCAVHGLGEWNEAVTWPDNEHIALIITDIVNSTDAMGNIVFNQEEYVLSVCQGLNVQEDLKMKASWLPDQEDLPPVQAEPPHVAAIAAPVMEAFQLPPLASIGVGVPAVQPPAV